MTLSEALLKILDDNEEPLCKRIKIAANAFKSPQVQIHNKEAILLKWAIENFEESEQDIFILTNKWISSEQFQFISQNDISTDDISNIVQLFLQLLKNSKLDATERKQICEMVLLLCANKVFQHYFKYNLKLYLKFLSITVGTIDLPMDFVDFLKRSCIFLKKLSSDKSFCKHFFNSLIPVLVRKGYAFKGNPNVNDELSKLLQKCIFNGNVKPFEHFFAFCMDGKETEKEYLALPKIVFKYLASTLDGSNKNTDITAVAFKTVFNAFNQSFSEFQLTYRFLVVTAQMLQINVSKDFSLSMPYEKTVIVSLKTTLRVFLSLLDVLKTRSYTECTISNIPFTNFIRKILQSFNNLTAETEIIYEIIHSCVTLNPLIIEPIAPFVLIYMMTTYNEDVKLSYEKVVICIFEVFAKLHRTENFIAKIIPTIKALLIGGIKEIHPTDLYDITKENNEKPLLNKSFSAECLFSESILQCFTNCINGLASWQVINVFKTLLFHLKEAVAGYSDQNSQDSNDLTYLEILGTLIKRLLQSVRIADYTIPQNVIEKLVKCLDDLQIILKQFGLQILKREHNHMTMRTFLNIAYIWGEIYMILTNYSMNHEVQMTKVMDNTYTTCNLRYLHSYLDVKEWQLVSQRITNFGEEPCKKLLPKLYIQKLRAMLVFEGNFNNDIVTNVVKTIQNQPEDTWRDLLLDKFAVNFILPKMDKSSLIFLSEKLIEDETFHQVPHIQDSVTLANSITYVAISKINSLFKHKRKLNGDLKKNTSSKLSSVIPNDIFFNKEEKLLLNIDGKEDTMVRYLKVLKEFPIIFSSVDIQKCIFLYLTSLYKDIINCSLVVKEELEDLIIGLLQTCKFLLIDVCNIETLIALVLKHFQRYDVVFSLIAENIFKNESYIKRLEPVVNQVATNLENFKYLSCGILLIQAANKIKKTKMDGNVKELVNQYKEKVFGKIAKLVCKSDYLIEAYATCLKHYLSLEQEQGALKKLLDKLASYIQYSLENINSENKKGCVILFTAVLHNKQKIKDIDEDIILKVWNACKKVEIGEDYSPLVKLIVTLIPNDEFQVLVADLFTITEQSIKDKNYTVLSRQLKMWESILTCNVNPVKMKLWHEVLEKLIQALLDLVKNGEYDDTLLKSIVHLEENVIQTQHLMLSSPLIDMFIINVTILMHCENQCFETRFNFSISILEKLLKHRNAMIMDRLSPFLQQYRVLLIILCAQSNSDDSLQTVKNIDVNKASDYAHRLEKLTKSLVSCKKDMSRIAVFLIADILARYEHINLFPNVKLHLNNCIYSLISLCDHHAVSYLMRVLSSASTEMFKILYEHYKKYYMFTGKV